MSKKYLLARTVAQAMTRFLERNETSIHWVQVIGEDSLVTKPSKAWPVVNDPMFNLMIQDGWSEGMLVYIYAQVDRYKPEEVVPVLRIKMLAGRKGVFSELPLIFAFLDQIEGLPLEGQTCESAGNDGVSPPNSDLQPNPQLAVALEATGFVACEFAPDSDECECCNQPNLQLYFQGPEDAGRYFCAACVTAEHASNVAFGRQLGPA